MNKQSLISFLLTATLLTGCGGSSHADELPVPEKGTYSNPVVASSRYTVVIGPNERFVGNGHCSEIVQDKSGNDWLLYHGVDRKSPHGRVLLLDQIRWDSNGWPYVEGNSPSVSASVPVFK